MSGTSPPLTAFQIRIRPRSAKLLVLMSEQQRRRPQDQAAWLVELALEAWIDDAHQHHADEPGPSEETVEWASTP